MQASALPSSSSLGPPLLTRPRRATQALRGAPISYLRNGSSNGWGPPEAGRLHRGGASHAGSHASSFASRLSQVPSRLPSPSIAFHSPSMTFHSPSITCHRLSQVPSRLPSPSMTFHDLPSPSVIFHHLPSPSTHLSQVASLHSLQSSLHPSDWTQVRRHRLIAQSAAERACARDASRGLEGHRLTTNPRSRPERSRPQATAP